MAGWWKRLEILGVANSEKTAVFLSKARYVLTGEEFLKLRSLMQQHDSNQANFHDLLISVRHVCLGKDVPENERRKALWAEFLGIITPAEARMAFHPNWEIPRIGIEDASLEGDVFELHQLTSSRSCTPARVSTPASDLPSSRTLVEKSTPLPTNVVNSQTRLANHVKPQVPGWDCPFVQRDWQPDLVAHAASTSQLAAPKSAAITGPSRLLQDGQQFPVELTDISARGDVERADTEALGWWPLTSLPLRTAFEMMKLAAERAASIGGTVATPPGLNESDFQEELSCLQAGETNGGLGTVEGTRQAGLVRSGFWQSTGTETERGTSTAATQLYPFSYTDASVSRANGEDSWSMERPLLAQDQSAKSSFDFSDALTPLDDTREIQVTHTGDTYSKRRRLIYENYGTFFFWLLSKVGI